MGMPAGRIAAAKRRKEDAQVNPPIALGHTIRGHRPPRCRAAGGDGGPGHFMEPTLRPGALSLLDRSYCPFHALSRGDIVVLRLGERH
jgi:hypothetical protein